MPPRIRTLRLAAAALTAGACVLAAAPPATAAAPHGFRPGAPGGGDPYFPAEGNGGYDVGHYDLSLDYAPAADTLAATAVISARATQDLSRFDLDLKQLTVKSVTVNGRKAKYTRKGQELAITPAKGLHRGKKFTVKVVYGGTPKPIERPDIGKFGWIKTPDGAYVVSEPDGASTWFPSNDHPQDKATYTYKVTVPKGTQVLSNGEPGGTTTKGGKSTFVWNERTPMASYLAMLAIGKFQVKKGKTASGVPVITAVAPNRADELTTIHDDTIKAIDWEEKVFGKYPFQSTGGIRVGVDVEFSLETQSRPIYGFEPDQGVIVHELAHQWFGDSVSVKRWKDIWLNEGFATYAEWLWDEQHGGRTAKQTFDLLYNEPTTWPYYADLWTARQAGNPGADEMFTLTAYYRGGMTLQALRGRIGDKAFFALLKQWTKLHRNGNVTTKDFIALAEKVSHKQLDGLFHAWLYTKSKPTTW
ncbi:M1 family metallopeptidase [Actinomadura parmotrematis]|uniref:Aminopeptidase N n=1 Tax=Actinomadura parmotrematis TaxID=2864039 RepID=A0ABS7G0K2_9ACTN|nr:M1 family metallopeptidase [Actinomadura parmotrematis]MBW8486244.1 M1 family metallopeptidase [Actinomadura parmotrematis]